jgi:hypothetical protein
MLTHSSPAYLTPTRRVYHAGVHRPNAARDKSWAQTLKRRARPPPAPPLPRLKIQRTTATSARREHPPSCAPYQPSRSVRRRRPRVWGIRPPPSCKSETVRQ